MSVASKQVFNDTWIECIRFTGCFLNYCTKGYLLGEHNRYLSIVRCNINIKEDAL